jgi:hypothetical protein
VLGHDGDNEPRAAWLLKGCRSSLARAVEMPHSRRQLFAYSLRP